MTLHLLPAPAGLTGLDDASYAALGPLLDHRRYRRGEQVLAAGAPAALVHFVQSGAVRRRGLTAEGRPFTFDYLLAGSVFGGPGGTLWAVEATSATELACVPYEAYARLARRHPALGALLSAALERQLQRTQRQLQRMGFLNLRERLLAMLQDMATELGEEVPQGRRIPLRLTHQDLAELVGSTREACSLAVAKLEAQRLLRFEEKRPVLLKPSRARKQRGAPA